MVTFVTAMLPQSAIVKGADDFDAPSMKNLTVFGMSLFPQWKGWRSFGFNCTS